LHTTFASDYPRLTLPLPLTGNCEFRTHTHTHTHTHTDNPKYTSTVYTLRDNTSTMCYKLLQVYICGHEKTVSTTPCPHAIATGRRVPQVDATMTPELSRSSSVVSSMAPAATRRSNVQDLSLQRASGAQSSPSPRGTQGRQQDGAPPTFRFVAPGQGPLPSSPSYSQLSPTSSTPSQEPSPTFSITATLVNQPSMLFTPADPEVNDGYVVPSHWFPQTQ